MGHGITPDDRAVYAVPAWHNLGKINKNLMSAVQGMKENGMDYRIEKLDKYIIWNGEPKLIEDSYAVTRMDNGIVLGEVGPNYNIHQNLEMAELADLIIGGSARIESLFTVDKGARVVILAKMPKDIDITGKNDMLEQFIVFYNTHNGSSNLEISPTTVRVVCANTIQAYVSENRKNKSGIKIRHSKNMATKIEEAKQTLLKTREAFDRSTEEMKHMAKTKVKRENVVEYYRGLLKEVIKLSEEAPGAFLDAAVETTVNGKHDTSNLLDQAIEETEAQKYTSMADFITKTAKGKRIKNGKTATEHRLDKALETVLGYYENDPKQTDTGAGGTAWAALNGFTQWIDHDQKYHGQGLTRLEQRLKQTVLPGGRGTSIKMEAYSRALALK